MSNLSNHGKAIKIGDQKNGIELKKFGYTNIDGADLSKKLLDLVPKGFYNKLEQIDLNKPLNKKSNIYDELTSFIEINNIRDDIEYITKYDLIDRFNKKGEEAPQHSFNYYREIAAIDPNSENIMEQRMEILGKIFADKKSTYNFLKNSSPSIISVLL